MQKLATFMMAASMLSACVTWPDAGQGGMAELRHPQLTDNSSEKQIEARLVKSKSILADIVTDGAQLCTPGQVVAVKAKLIRAERELYAGVLDDAQWHLTQIGYDLIMLRCHLLAVKQNTGCAQSASEKLPAQSQWSHIDNYQVCVVSLPIERAIISPVSAHDSGDYRVVMLNEALFDFDKADIKPIYFPQLELLANLLTTNQTMRLRLDGHTDDRGSQSYNEELALRRAHNIAEFFVQRGVDQIRMHIESHGETDPRVANDTSEQLQLNRRVEIRIEALDRTKLDEKGVIL